VQQHRDAEHVLKADPMSFRISTEGDGRFHGGGGKLITQTSMALEMVHCGNPRCGRGRRIDRQHKALKRVIIGNDAPQHRVVPWDPEVLNLLAGFPVTAEQAICMATAIRPGSQVEPRVHRRRREADLVVMDAPSARSVRMHSRHRRRRQPGISFVLVDARSGQHQPHTPPATRKPTIKASADADGLNC